MPVNKRLQPCGPPSPANMSHRSAYLQAPPGRDQSPAMPRYSLQMASVPASYDPAAAVAAAAFHAQPYPPVSSSLLVVDQDANFFLGNRT